MKAAMTRKVNEVRDLIEAGDYEETIRQRMKGIKSLFDKFFYDRLQDMSYTAQSVCEQENSDGQLATVEENYHALVDEAEDWERTVREPSLCEDYDDIHSGGDTVPKSVCAPSDGKRANLGNSNEPTELECADTDNSKLGHDNTDSSKHDHANEGNSKSDHAKVDNLKQPLNNEGTGVKVKDEMPEHDAGGDTEHHAGQATNAQCTGVENVQNLNPEQTGMGGAGMAPPWWLGPHMASCMDTLQLPKSELMNFDGDPLKYHRFMSSFENSVGCLLVDDNSKLNRLFQYCTGPALKVIECCSVMDPTLGYRRALSLLKERFGNNYTISEAWISRITAVSSIRPSDRKALQKFADELTNCTETLRAMACTGEIDTQRSLVKIVERLHFHVQLR
jgi:hypothetical protein